MDNSVQSKSVTDDTGQKTCAIFESTGIPNNLIPDYQVITRDEGSHGNHSQTASESQGFPRDEGCSNPNQVALNKPVVAEKRGMLLRRGGGGKGRLGIPNHRPRTPNLLFLAPTRTFQNHFHKPNRLLKRLHTPTSGMPEVGKNKSLRTSQPQK